MRGMGAGIMVVVLSAIFASVGVGVLIGVNTEAWATIDQTIFSNIPTFILLGVLALAAFSYKYG